jgi:hypothetical protein
MKYLFLIITTLFFFNSSAQNDATYLKIHKTYVLNEDGSYDFTYNHKLKYESYISFHRKYGETFVVYNPQYQNVKVTECKTTMRDGKVVVAPDNAFNEVLPRFAEHSGAYNHLRELVITHTGLEVGAIVDLTYTIHSDTIPTGFFSGKESQAYSSPVKELQLTFKVPANTQLNFAGVQGQKVFNENNNQKVYTFNFKDLSASVKQTRAGGDAGQVLYFNQGKSLETQLFEIMQSKIIPNEFDKSFVGFNKENIEEILSIHRKVVKETRTIQAPLAFQNYPIPAIKTIKKYNSGTPIEKALLLRQMLWDMKIAANIAFEFPVEQFDKKISNLENITSIYVMVPGTSDPLLLPVDDIPITNPLFSNYDKAVVILKSDKSIERLGPQNMNYANLDLFITVGNTGSEVSFKGVVNGIYAGWPGDNVKSSKRITNYVTEIEDDVVIENQSSIKMSGKFKSEFEQHGELMEVKLPILTLGTNQFIKDVLPQNEKYILSYSYPINETYTYRFSENNCTIVQFPNNYTAKNKFFEFAIKTEKIEDETVVKQIVNIKSPIIPADYYEKMREALIQLSKNSGRTILFKCKQ